MLLEQAYEKAKKERLKYEKAYKIIDKYLLENNMIINNPNLLTRTESIDDFQYLVYSREGFPKCNNLVNLLTKKTPYLWKLRTVFGNHTYHIYLDTRLILVCKELKLPESVKIIEPLKRNSHTTGKPVWVMSPEMMLLDVYRQLYSPASAGSWEDLVKKEDKLFEILTSRKKDIVGGKISKRLRDDLEKRLLRYIGDSNHILIGEHACKHLIDSEVITPVIEVLARDLNVDELKNVIHEIISDPVIRYDRELQIVEDFRLMRTTIKVGTQDDSIEVMYIYNSPVYDLVPFSIIDGIRVGNPFVVMRFLLINIWIVRWLRERGSINQAFATRKVSHQIGLVLKIRKALGDISLSSEGGKLGLFQRKNYLGCYLSDQLALKLQALDSDRRYPDYVPLAYKRQFGNFRTL